MSILSVRPGHRGFTLVELIVALAIAALVLGGVPMVLPRLKHASEYHSTVRMIFSGLNSARREAALSGRPRLFYVDLAKREFALESSVPTPIPESVDVRLIVADALIAPDGRGAIRFYPDGGATGGSVEIFRPSGLGTRVRVDWMLGRISLEPML